MFNRNPSPLPSLGAAPALLLTALLGAAAASSPAQGLSPRSLDPTFGLPRPPERASARASEREAAWIWAERVADNQTVYLRAAFTLPRAPKQAVVFVTADDFFTLFINGKQVDESHPDPMDGLVWSHVHRRSVVEALHAGKNVVALKGLNAGSAAGALLRLELDGKPALLTGSDWRAAEKVSDDWAAPGFDDSKWPPAVVQAKLGEGPWETRLDGWPGLAADAPYLAHLSLRPQGFTDVHVGAGAIEGRETLTSEKPVRLLVALPSEGSTDNPSLLLDFGKELAGRIELRASAPLGILVATGESKEEALKAPWGGVHRVDLTPGEPGASPYSAFRWAKITFAPPAAKTENAAGTGPPIEVGLVLDHKYYPVEYRGSFDCSDPLLTRIWYTGAYTAHLCMQEDIWDAPKRDRARWMGDLHVSGEVINDVFADRFLMEQTMQRLRDEAQGDHAPSDLPRSHINGIPGYSCAWIAGLADFHRHVGDYEYLKKQHVSLITMLEFLRGELDEKGLFVNTRKQWPFVDWAPDFNADGPLARQATHFFLVKAAREGAFLLKELGDDPAAAKYSAWADELTAAAQKHYLKAGTNTFSDRRQDNSMAIFAGVATPEQTRAIYDSVLHPGSAAWGQVATPYYNNYVLYAMSMAGHTREGLDILRSHWGGMLAEGATSFWEGYDPSWEKTDYHGHLQADNGTGYFVSLCHGWSAGPTAWLTDRVLGIQPTSGGFRTVRIRPDLGDLSWAEGAVPTPGGELKVRVEKADTDLLVKLTIPKGVTATIPVRDGAALNGRPVHAEHNALTFDRPGTYHVRFAPVLE